MEAERKITLKGIEPMLIFGVQDSHLRKIESFFTHTNIIARGNNLTLKGEEDDVKQIEKIFAELMFLVNQNGDLHEKDVDTVLKLMLSKPLHQESEPSLPLVDSEDIIVATKNDAVRARTPGQRKMVCESKQNDIVFAIGPAGTGKTYTAVAIAVAAMKHKEVNKIVLARPAVEAGESLGFLPGDLAQKIDPYLRPLYDALQDMLTSEKLKLYIEKKIIEIVPLAYMRGRTLNNAFIILDEAQNATSMQMKMCLTRLGMNSKAIITGDVTQIDLPNKRDSGLSEVQNLLQDIKGISFVYLNKSDVVRHKLVRDIIEAYDRFHGQKAKLEKKDNNEH
ncbi:PhoH family protein [Chloroherpeton thalassium ATCC 35110]|uniref:PhoH-like protein n=1 Tax=Chloroherpeton thalassium (strain ATCC 35110 / GB-78) TaxID=517418 RepID=B3QXS7_CHLT3|nr:PhoH family protein [Chloroherpeton thalassium]ACF14992.1 PhoH family protein [Chloroherpeton thalassium ATCC 35110]